MPPDQGMIDEWMTLSARDASDAKVFVRDFILCVLCALFAYFPLS
jgi:hypothetical protein